MGHSQRPRWRELRRLYEILNQCEQLGEDPAAWREHAVAGACELVNAKVGLYGDLDIDNPDSQPGAEIGWDSQREAAILHEFWESGAIYHSAWFPRYRQRFMPNGTAISPQLFEPGEWSLAPTVHRWLKPAGLGHHLLSIRVVPDREAWFDHMCLFRDVNDGPPGRREQLLLKFLHDGLHERLGRTLRVTGEPAVVDLSPRQQQVLDLVLRGCTDQQIADLLHLSRHTVVDHVRDLRRHFDVESRVQLCARFLQRYRGDRRFSGD